MKKTIVSSRSVKSTGRNKKGKKLIENQKTTTDGRIILVCPKPNKFRKAHRRELIKSIKAYEASKTSNIEIVGYRPNDFKRVRDFQQRRRILDHLIVKRRKFFLSEIEKDFSDATGGYRCVDPFTPVKKYIRNLEEVGALDKKMDLYIFVP